MSEVPHVSPDIVTSDAGAGFPLVLVHGVGSDSRVWNRMTADLSKRFRLIRIDLPGISTLRLAEPQMSIVELSLAVDAAMADRDVESYAIVGHSFGGVVALAVAQAFPRHVASLSLIAPGGFGPEINPALWLMATRSGAVLLRLAHRPVVRRRLERVAARSRTSTRDNGSLDELLDTYYRLGTQEAQKHFKRSVATVLETRRKYADVAIAAPDVPVQIIWGERDLVLPVWQSTTAARALNARHVHIIPGAGHAPHSSHAAALARIVGTFADPASRES